ncbi:MAG: 23S rRNA (adenine(2503)-C(2))-methyltransferase RlmN [Candidatus Omnitrophica bacterium]|nr:23S rRNA (adenine(2503)-C(2))-methyltransferase RlmN [Candidatus Omnitrophota bacterium]
MTDNSPRKINIKEYSLEEVKQVLQKWQEPLYHARQIFSWVYKKGARDFAALSDLPQPLRDKLEGHFTFFDLRVAERLESKDGTVKLLLAAADGNSMEAVSIPTAKRTAGCVSTQAGCKFACGFCASGLRGFKRDLTTGEILDQVFLLKDNSPGRVLTHLVFMGTGEPFDNYDNVMKAIRMINAPEGINIGARRITISTCGIIPGIQRLAGEGLQIELSVSLHAADDQVRSRIMPVNRKYPLPALLEACRAYAKNTGRQVTFEYILIRGLNSDLRCARKLCTIVKGMNAKINLIPANAVGECGFEAPSREEIWSFRDFLAQHGVHVTLRRERGTDIQAACGQLRIKYER